MKVMDSMDTRTAARGLTENRAMRSPAEVAAALDEIKRFMPETYKAIQAKADAHGSRVYAMVRRGLRGEVNQWYAMERGRVMGTPFDLPQVTDGLARYIVQFGCSVLVMWSPELAAAESSMVPPGSPAAAGQGA